MDAAVKQEFLLENEVQDMILDVANAFNELDTSDLQGVATVKAKQIIASVRHDAGLQAIDMQRTASQFATIAECAAYNQALRDFAAKMGVHA